MLTGSCLCGAVQWQYRDMPTSATACSCTACRRYGTLWAYGWEGDDVHFSGVTKSHVRGEALDSLDFHFCPTCGCVAYWRGLAPNAEGKFRVGVNLRLSEPGPVAQIPIRHFDGFDSWKDLPNDGRCVKDMWF
jgi:hypothetical protein